MKQLFFAGSFAIAVFMTYGINSNSGNMLGAKDGINAASVYDTLPRSKKDSLKKKKYSTKDTATKKDSVRS